MKHPKSVSRWKIVAAGFLCMTVAAGVGWYVFPVYLTSIEGELGWSRSQMSLAVAVWALVGGAFSPFIGVWIDKYGPRRVMVLGTVVQIIATILLARITALWHLYALFVLAALANTANTTIPVSATISRWFDKERGTAMGIALLGMGFGGLAMPVIADSLLTHYGWRGGYSIFVYFLLALLVPIVLWIPGASAGARLMTDGGEAEAGPLESDLAGEDLAFKSMSPAESVRTRSFWSLGFGDFLISIVFTSVIVHMVAFTTDAGISQSSATHAYGAFLAVNSLGIVAFGAAADKIKIRGMMVVSYGAAAIAMLFLFRLPSLLPLYAFAVIFGITGGGRAALWPLALGESFGVGQLGSILGWLNIPFMIGNAVGPYLAGYIYDATKSYRLLFELCVACSIGAAFFVSRMRNERKPLEESIQTSPIA